MSHVIANFIQNIRQFIFWELRRITLVRCSVTRNNMIFHRDI